MLLVFSGSLQSCIKNKEEVEITPLKVAKDSVAIWIENSKNNAYPLRKRKQFLLQSYQTIQSLEIDTLAVRNLSKIAYRSLKLGDTLLFKKRNKATLTIAKKLKDTFAIGNVYWNYASYYIKIQEYDSAFYNFRLAHTYFDKKNYIFESAKTQYGMAFIKGRFKDYTGSEVLTFEAIKKFKKIKNYKSLFTCYNHLGQLQRDIKEYDSGLFYYAKAMEYIEKVKNNQPLYEAIYNNSAIIYVAQKEYAKALENYNKVLVNKRLKSQRVGSYARVIDNSAFCKFLMKDTTTVAKDLKEALYLRDSMNNKEGIVISKKHLAQYYAYKQDTSIAINYIKEATSLAKEIKNGGEYLESLFLLSKLDSKHSLAYLKKHIQFSDSLQNIERKTRNRFARIVYETDEYIEENKLLTEQKIWILVTSLGLILILGLLYFLKNQQSKTEKLLLENKQQIADEQVYLITLKQQEKLENERVKERNRIAEELHDGILGKLFGTRVGLGFLDIKGSKDIKEKHQVFLEELQTIEKEIREVSHKLSANFDSTQVNFTAIIRQLIESKCGIGNFRYELDFDEHINWQNVDGKIKVNLYRILQESLQNIIKYAFAKEVRIIFILNNKDLVLSIKDNGIGFDINKNKNGIGIKNMIARIKKLNGVFNIYSKRNEGTTIKIQIPIK